MTPDETRTETRAAALQIPAELDRGLDILDRQIRAGQFSAARKSVALLRSLVLLQETTTRQLLAQLAEDR